MTVNKNMVYLGAAILAIAALWFYLRWKRRNRLKKAVSEALGRELDAEQLGAVVMLSDAFNKYGDGDPRKLAYLVSTAWNETRFRPDIEEINPLPWYGDTGYYGRGLSQLTHEGNYKKMGEFFGRDFVTHPDEVKGQMGADILTVGMMRGMFRAGHDMERYFNDTTTDYYNARKIVNGVVPNVAEQNAVDALKIFNKLQGVNYAV